MASAARPQRFTLIKDDEPGTAAPIAPARELDWSILMARTQGGDREAYRRLLAQITPYLRSLAMRHQPGIGDLVEDAVQDILLTLHTIRHTYDPARPFGPWLTAIAKHRLVDCLRRQGRLRTREAGLTPEHETFAAPRSNWQEEVPDRRRLAAAVGRLPLGQRQAITLLKLEERSLKEAAAITGMTVGSLKVATHRALNTLRRMLGNGDAER
jgi:RNA polymerase sigma-70 factor (ECF subfamily)